MGIFKVGRFGKVFEGNFVKREVFEGDVREENSGERKN